MAGVAGQPYISLPARSKLLRWHVMTEPTTFATRIRRRTESFYHALKNEPTLVADSFFVAGVAGLEPTTPGFGDQCSTN